MLPPPPQKLDYRTESYDGFVLSVNRLDRYKRIDLLIKAAKADPALRLVIVGDGPDRERLEKLASGRQRPDRVRRARRRRRARRSLRALPRGLLRAGGRGLRDGPLRGVPLREAGDHDLRRRRPARGRARRGDGPRRPAGRRPTSRRPAPTSPAISTRRALSARRARRWPSGSPGTSASTRCSREGRLLLAAAAVPLGDRRLLHAASPGASRAHRRGRRREPGKRPPPADVALYHIGNNPEAHGWIVDALRKRPGIVVLHELVLHHLIAGITIGRGDGRGYLDAMERDFGVPGRLIGLGVLDNLLPLIWETQPDRFPLTGTILDLARGPDRALALRRDAGSARPGTAGRSGGSRIPPGRTSRSSPPRSPATRSSAASGT